MENLSTSCALSEDDVGESEMDMVFVEGNEHITVKERINSCCKPRYQVRKLKNKGAIMVLAWNFLVTSVFLLHQLSDTGELQLLQHML